MTNNSIDKERVIACARECLKCESAAIEALIHRLDDSFVEAVQAIHSCRGKIVVTGVGKSGHIGSKIAATLASTGTPAFFLNPLDAYHGDLGMLSSDDLVLAISYSGATDELLRLIPMLQERHIPIIAMSSNADSLLAKYSAIHLSIAVDHEADPLDLVPTSSTTVTLALGDALACALMEVREFKESDFAQFHPGGNLGRRLLTKVENKMVTTNLPVITPNTKACDAIFDISKNKQGIAVVVDEGKIVGAVTDGDIRRAMQSNRDGFLVLPVSDIMSRSPKMILSTAKLSEAEALMRKHSIHSLIVVNEEKQLVGIVDYFSCI